MGYPIGDTARLLAEVEHKYHEWEKRQMLDEKFAALDARWKKAKSLQYQREQVQLAIDGLRQITEERGIVCFSSIGSPSPRFDAEIEASLVADVLIDRLIAEDERLAKELEAIL